jgi:hypothetical protein
LLKIIVETTAKDTTAKDTTAKDTTAKDTTAKDTTAKNSSRAGTTEMEMTRTGTTATKKVAHKQLSTKKVTPEDLAMDIPASEKVLAESIVMKAIPTDIKQQLRRSLSRKRRRKGQSCHLNLPPSYRDNINLLPLYTQSPQLDLKIHLIRQYTLKKEVRSGVRSFVGI